MTPELEFIQKNTIPIAAFCWEKFQEHGPGIVLVKSGKSCFELAYVPLNNIPDDTLRSIVEPCDFSKEIIVALNEYQVLKFEPEPSPERCYEIDKLKRTYRKS